MKVPSHFSSFLSAQYEGDTAQRLITALETEPSPVSIRLNPLKDSSAIPAAWLTEGVAWSAGLGYYLKSRPAFTFDPLFHAGHYYVQEASSMFLAHALKHILPRLADSERPLRALDLCAAPGGKSTLLRSLLPADAFLLSNEPMKQRASVLKENITKWGHPDTAVSSGYASDIASTGCRFDLIVTDVPCSGEGMMRKEADAVAQWSEQLTHDCAKLQRSIISDIWESLNPGGFLIYSTCTFNRNEDEENVRYLCDVLGAEYIDLAPEAEWNIYTSGPSQGYHFLPHLTRGEGFFLAVVRKDETEIDTDNPSHRKKNRKKQKEAALPDRNAASVLSAWIDELESYSMVWNDVQEEYSAVPKAHADFVEALRKGGLHLLQAGIPLARPKGRKLQPHAALALSTALRKDAFPEVEVTLDMARAYLRTESLVLPPEAPRGHVVITYHGARLGFANNLGSRANNLYPSEWRIRTTYLPTHEDVE